MYRSRYNRRRRNPDFDIDVDIDNPFLRRHRRKRRNPDFDIDVDIDNPFLRRFRNNPSIADMSISELDSVSEFPIDEENMEYIPVDTGDGIEYALGGSVGALGGSVGAVSGQAGSLRGRVGSLASTKPKILPSKKTKSAPIFTQGPSREARDRLNERRRELLKQIREADSSEEKSKLQRQLWSIAARRGRRNLRRRNPSYRKNYTPYLTCACSGCNERVSPRDYYYPYCCMECARMDKLQGGSRRLRRRNPSYRKNYTPYLTCACGGCNERVSMRDYYYPYCSLDCKRMVQSQGSRRLRRRNPEIRYVNCAGCGVDLPSDKIAGRIRDKITDHLRPYCAGCLDISSAGVSGISGGAASPIDEMSVLQQKAYKEREGRRLRRRNPYNPYLTYVGSRSRRRNPDMVEVYRRNMSCDDPMEDIVADMDKMGLRRRRNPCGVDHMTRW